jgi:lactate dehydrogenase-like 2-hydroxyacid dehydrogenase
MPSHLQPTSGFEEKRMSANKPVLVVTTHFLDEIEARIDRDYDARRSSNGRPFTGDELVEAAAGADALLITPFDQLGSDFVGRLPASVKVIATCSVGIDHIDLQAAANRRIAIAYTPGINAEATAEIAMLLMLGASRRAYEGQEMVRTGTRILSNLVGRQLTGKVLGIFGMGRVGRAVAQRARGFGMTIHYFNPGRLPAELENDAVFHSNPSDLFRVSEVLSLHAPETPETHHLINAQSIDLLPQGAILINTARGGMVVDEDLIAALKSGRVAAAGLDVFEGEPKLHPGYLALKNTFLLPHMGGATVEAILDMAMLALDNIDAVLGGKPAPSLVTRESVIT